MRNPITVSEMIQILQSMDPTLPVQMSMNMEYQSRVCNDMVEVFTREDGTQYCLITDCPTSEWEEDYQDEFDEYDGQPDEAQEWADFDPDC